MTTMPPNIPPANPSTSLGPLSQEEMARLTADTESLTPYKQPVIDALKKALSGAESPEQALGGLLAALPPELHAVATLRFRHEMALIKPDAAQNNAAPPPQPAAAVPPSPQVAAAPAPPPTQATAASRPGQPDKKEMELLAAETEQLQPHKQIIVTVLMKVANDTATPEKALEELIAALPPEVHEAAKRRFRYEMGIIEARKNAPKPPAPPRRQGAAMGTIFDMAAAILLMASGTYEKIRDLMRKRPDLVSQVKQLGERMLKNGVSPDMAMVEKLQRIILQAQKFEKEKQEAMQKQK